MMIALAGFPRVNYFSRDACATVPSPPPFPHCNGLAQPQVNPITPTFALQIVSAECPDAQTRFMGGIMLRCV